jgi:hypothetical protein
MAWNIMHAIPFLPKPKPESRWHRLQEARARRAIHNRAESKKQNRHSLKQTRLRKFYGVHPWQ